MPLTALLTGTVWTDVDGDGMQDASEIGIEGATVQVIDPGPDGKLGTVLTTRSLPPQPRPVTAPGRLRLIRASIS